MSFPASSSSGLSSPVKETSILNKPPAALNWNCDGRFLATASHDKKVVVSQFDQQTGNIKLLQTLSNIHDQVNQIAWHPADSQRFMISGQDKVIEIWDVRASKCAYRMPSDGRHVSSAWSPDGNYAVVVNEENYIALYDMRTQTKLKRIRSANEANELAWTADSNYLLISAMLNGGPAGGIEILECKDGNFNLQDSLTAHTANCLYLKIDPTFRRVALGGEDHLLSLWDLDDLICTHTVHCESSVKSLSFNGDGRRIAVSTEAGTIIVCDSLSSDIVGRHVLPRTDRATHIAWHPTAPVIAMGIDSKAPMASYLRLLSVPASMQ